MEKKSIWMSLFEQYLMQESSAYFSSLGLSEKRTLFEGVNAVSFINTDCMLSHIEVAPWINIPEHSHAYSQMGILLGGELEMVIDSESRNLGKDDIFIIPPHTTHRARTTREGSRLIELYTPLDSSLMKRVS